MPEARHVGHEHLDDEPSTRAQARRDVAEAPHLICLREKLEERVEDDEDQRELVLDRDVGHVADRHVDAVAAGFRVHLRDHRGRRVDAVHLDAERR